MKRLISQFRKLPFTNRVLASENLPFTVFVATVLVAVSCQLSQKTELETATDPGTRDPMALDVTPPLAPEGALADTPAVPVLAKNGGQAVKIGDILGLECGATPQPSVELKTSLNSAFGAFPATFVLSGEPGKEVLRGEVEHFHLSFAAKNSVKAALIADACAAKSKAQALTLSDLELAEWHDWMALLAPDCRMLSATEGGWKCQLPAADAKTARENLTAIQTTMIKRWSRQPYLLARRVALGISLASALESEKNDKQLDTLCKIVKASLPVELPATVSSLRWQVAVCGKASASRREAAAFGLSKIVTEVDFMRQLFERTSRLGFLVVHIPTSAAPAKEILVSLTPEANVADNLTKATSRFWNVEKMATPGAAAPDDLPRVCWHPVFGESMELLKLARQLTMAGESSRVACAETDKAGAKLATERYFAESSTSETEFVITNGRSKTLRLPTGSYKYTLRPLPDDPDEWDDASQVVSKAVGQIDWDAKRPRPVISTW